MGHDATGHSINGGAREGLRASFLKRRSFFARPESMSSFGLRGPQHSAPITAVPDQPHGVSYHNPPNQQQHYEPTEVTPVQQKRRSIFSGRFRLGGRKEDHSEPQFEYQQPRGDPSPQYAEQLARTQHVRGLSLPATGRVNHYSEVDYYRSQKKATISPPFNFQHVTHTQQKHLPALETVDEKDLTKEFWAASAYQVPQRQLQGIQADDLARKLGTMGLPRGAPSSQIITPPRSDQRPPPPANPTTRVRSNSREDITALPGFVPLKKETAIPRRQDVDALLGVAEKKPQKRSESSRRSESVKPRSDGLRRAESVKPKNGSATSLLSLDFSMRPTRSHSTSSRRAERILRAERADAIEEEDSSAAMLGFGYSMAKRSVDSSRSAKTRDETKGKASMESTRPSESSPRVALSALLGNKERSQSESSMASSVQKRNDVNSLLGLSTKDQKRQSKSSIIPAKQEEVNALLGIRPKEERTRSKSRQPPAPLRPRRSDEAFKSIPYEMTPPAPSPHMPSPSLSTPERPKRANENEQFLRDMGFAQLLYRTNSNESRHSHNNSGSNAQFALPRRSEDRQFVPPRRSEDRRSRMSIDAESVYPTDVPEYPNFNQSFDHVAEEAERNVHRTQQTRYKAVQPLPSLPEQYDTGHEVRAPLQTVVEHAEFVSPVQSPADSAMSPVSPTSTHSARMLSPLRSPELTGPGMPDDETWMDEIDFLYKQHAEATNDFDWDNVSMTTHDRLSVRDPDKRLSLNIPSHISQGATGLSKKLSEGSLRQSYHLPSSRTSMNMQYIHRDFHNPRKYFPQESHVEEDAQAGSRTSPEVRVIDVDNRADSRQQQHDVAALHMHGYESLAAGYLSDPESSSSQHRKSNSYGSWDSRRSVIAQKEQPGRSSSTSVSSIPDLMHTRRGPKQPITTLPQLPQSPYQEPPAQNPMNEYAAFSAGPYAGGSESRPQSAHQPSIENQHYPMPPLPHQLQPQQMQHHHHHHYYHQPQDHTASSDYLSLRRPETIDENNILRAAGDAVKHGRTESRPGNRYLHTTQQQPHHYQEEQAGWI